MSTTYSYGDYKLMNWKKGDFGIPRFSNTNISLYRDGSQIGAGILIADNELLGMKIIPTDKGHGTAFLELLIRRAKSLGKTIFKVDSVTGLGSDTKEINENRKKMEHILKKMRFAQKRNHWELTI